MTIDKQKLKALAEAANAVTTDVNITMAVGADPVEVKAIQDYLQVAMPKTVLALLAEIERLQGFVLRRREKEVEYDDALCKVANQRDQLKAENDTLKAAAMGIRDAWREDQAEMEALRKDAERYRFVRKTWCPDWPSEKADAQIDAAMAKEASHG